jgi:Tfp pilus assembly protein PilV
MVAGLAGSAALLLQTVRQERESGNRRAALRIATSMADQLRAIRRPDGRPVLAITGVEPATACADYAASCAPERAAEQLRITWESEAAFALPQGAAVGGGTERLRLPVTT